MRNTRKPRVAVIAVNRAARVTQHGGCKSGNAATVLARLGAEVTYLTFTGGALGAVYESYYKDEPMNFVPIPTTSGVRLNVKLSDGEGLFTECNQAGGPVSERECAALLDALRALDFDCLYLAGSIPLGLPTDFYATCVKMAREKGAYSVVDADGEVLKAALAAAPDLVKPNRAEFERLLPSGAGLGEKIKQFREKYPQTVLLLSLGSEGALLIDKEKQYKASALAVRVRGTVAAGDTFLSAFTYATLGGEHAENALKRATAAAAAKVALEGTALPSREQLKERISEVIVTEFQDK